MAEPRTAFLDLAFDRLSLDEALDWAGMRPAAAPFAYVVTPNVDHLVRLADEPADSPVRAVYREATLCLCDSRVLARVAKLCGVTLSVVPGSDLTARLLAGALATGDRLCLIGGDARLLADLRARLPGTEIVQHVPPMRLRENDAARDAAAAFAAEAGARFTLLAVGSPQQELLAWAIASRPDARGIGLCIGASVEFVTGAKARAPRWMRTAGIEWLHRLLSEPRRLWRRYLVDGPRIFAMAWMWRRRQQRR